MSDISKLLCAELARNLTAGDRPRVPAGGELLWRWFQDLHGTRQVGFSGFQPLTYAEIDAYARLHRLPLEPRHVGILRAMDRAFFAAIDKAKPPEGVKALPPISSRPMSAALFDAVMQ